MLHYGNFCMPGRYPLSWASESQTSLSTLAAGLNSVPGHYASDHAISEAEPEAEDANPDEQHAIPGQLASDLARVPFNVLAQPGSLGLSSKQGQLEDSLAQRDLLAGLHHIRTVQTLGKPLEGVKPQATVMCQPHFELRPGAPYRRATSKQDLQ